MLSPGTPDHEPADAVTAERLDRILCAEPAAREALLAELCAAAPDAAAALRKRYRALQGLGLLDDATEPPEQIGPFLILEPLGEGGMGIVYRAYQRGLDREVAVKMMRAEFVLLGPQRQRFEREGRIVAQLEHPAIVPILQVGDHEGLPFLAMQYVPGRSLSAVIETLTTDGALPDRLDGNALVAAMDRGAEGVDEVAMAASLRGLSSRWSRVVARVLLPVAEALGFAHERGIVHRDVKPSNILLSRDGRTFLCDFGLASFGDHEERITRSGSLLGSVPYMSPEQVEGQLVDARSDVFAFGSVLGEMLTLRRTFGSASTSHTMHAIASEEPLALTDGAGAGERDLLAILGKCLEKRPTRRYRDGGELATDLHAFLDGRPVAARRWTPVYRFVRYARREPLRFVLASATAVLLLVAASLGGYLWAERGVLAAGRSSLHAEQVEGRLAHAYLAMFRDDRVAAGAAFRSCLQLEADNDAAKVGLSMLAGELPVAAVEAGVEAPPIVLFTAAASSIFGGRRGDRTGAQRAIQLLEQVVLRQPVARPLFHGVLAKAAAVAGDEAKARSTAHALMELWPTSSAAAYWAGYARIEFAPQDAVAAFEHALRLEPEHAEAWAGLGAARLLLGDAEAAILALENTVRLRPDDAFAWLELGYAQQAAGQTEGAEATLRRSVALPAAPPGASYNLGVLLAARDPGAAIEAFSATVAQAPDYAEAWYNLGALRTRAGALPEGRAALMEAVRLRPEWGDAWRHLGANEATAGNAPGAVEAYRQVVRLEPEDQAAKQYLETLLSHLKSQEQQR